MLHLHFKLPDGADTKRAIGTIGNTGVSPNHP